MELNCKQGDLAVIVRSSCGNEGKVVRCVKLLADWWSFGPQLDRRPGAAWITDPPVNGWLGRPVPVRDALLRPIRDSDGEDEVLRYAGRHVGAPQEAERWS